MKTKKLSKKLCLNKETISNVNAMEIAGRCFVCEGCAGSYGKSHC